MGTQASERPAEQGLRANALRLLQLTFVGLAYFSLAPVIYFNMGLMESEAGGPVMPLLFILIYDRRAPHRGELRDHEQPAAVRRKRLHLALGEHLPDDRSLARVGPHDHLLPRRLDLSADLRSVLQLTAEHTRGDTGARHRAPGRVHPHRGNRDHDSQRHPGRLQCDLGFSCSSRPGSL
jgi:hypothetical protein